MSFLHPGIATAALVAALAPLVLHLLSRRGYRREPWAAMRFVMAAERRVRRQLRLEKWLLLTVRTLLLLFFGLALARPILATAFGSLAPGGRRSDVVIVIDDSLSMQARRPDGLTSFDAALRTARDLIARAPPGDGFSLVRAGRPAEALLAACSRDQQLLERLLTQWECSTRMTDLPGAWNSAARIVSERRSAGAGRACYVFSDFARGSPESTAAMATAAAAREPTQRETPFDRVVLVDVGPPDRANLALVSLEQVGEIVAPGIPVPFRVAVANERDDSIERVRVEISVNGAVVARVFLGPIPAHETKNAPLSLVFAQAGTQRITARIVEPSEDALSHDNERFLTTEVPGRRSVLCVQDDPDAALSPDPLLYVKAALKAGHAADGEGGFQVSTTGSWQLDERRLHDHDLVILGNVRRLAEAQWRGLERFVRGGGGLLMFLGSDVSASDYPHRSSRSPSALISFSLQRIVRIDDADGLPSLIVTDARHGALWDFAGEADGGLTRATVRGYWRVGESDQENPRPLISLSTGPPVLLEKRLGRGGVMHFLAGADMTWTTLPAKPDYVPLMLNLASRLTRARFEHGSLFAGAAFVHHLDLAAARGHATLTDPRGDVRRYELFSDDQGAWVTTDPLDRAGYYTLAVAGETVETAVNYAADDRDLVRMSPGQITRLFGRDARLVTEVDAAPVRAGADLPTDFSKALALAALGFMAIEMYVSVTRSRRR